MNPITQLLNNKETVHSTDINTQFAQFLKSNEGKSAEQIARENNIDFNLVKNLWQMLKK